VSTETTTPYETAQAIAEQLDPAEWSAEEGETNWEREREAALVGPDGMRIRLQWDRGRVTATGVRPPELHGFSGAWTEIGFSADKPPAVMAKDIKNRLLPRYRGSLDEIRAKKAAQDAREADRDLYVSAAAALLAPLGDVDQFDGGKIAAGRYRAPVSARVEVDVQYDYEGAHPAEARVNVTVRRDLLPRLAAALAALTDPPADQGLRGALAAQAAIWAQASADRHVDEVEDSDDVENDTMSEVYGEAARFLRTVVLEHPLPEPAGAIDPQQVWLAWRDGVDDLVGFETEARRDQYAEAVPGTEVGVLEVLNDSAAGQFIIDAGAEAAEEAEEAEDGCECSGEIVPGALPGFNGRNEIQACNTCNRYRDDEAAAAIAVAVGGEVVEHADDDPNRDPGGTWLTVVKDGEELTAERISELAAERAAAKAMETATAKAAAEDAAEDLGPTGPCPRCGARDRQRWQNADDDRATCGECGEEYWDTTVDGGE
jgi:hypothetical protein